MFYSHQLLARKTSLGQIWMAATMHAKINRRKLDQIDIIQICEEILNPSVPMALRLSGILMGGVVIVYERKISLLHDDVNRLLIEINAAWKVKPTVDRTILPKRKTRAKFEDVTMPENQDTDIGDVEQSIDYSSRTHTAMAFQQSSYISMRLDTIDELHESFIEPHELHHQADFTNITLDDPFDSHRADRGPYNRFERFDTEEDGEAQFNIPSQEHTQIPTTSVYSPPAMQPEKGDSVQHEGKQVDQSSAERGETEQQQSQQGLQRRRAPGKRGRRQGRFIMDDQTMIPNNLYQSWLKDSTDLSAKRPIVGKVNPKSTMKFTKLIELPPVALSCGLLGRDHVLYYPEQLLQVWQSSIQPPHGATTSNLGREPSLSPPHRRQEYQDPPDFPFGNLGTEVESDGLVSTQKLRKKQPLGAEFPNFSPVFNGVGSADRQAQKDGSGTHSMSFGVPSTDPGIDYLSNTSGSNSGRSNKKRPHSSSRPSGSGLERLDEETQWVNRAGERNFPLVSEQVDPMILRHSRPVLTPEYELLIETEATQTQRPFVLDEETETVTRNVTKQLKTYFEASGAPQTDSLNQLAYGLNRKQAAQFFYQTCVLATRDVLKVEQALPYGDITISRGPKM